MIQSVLATLLQVIVPISLPVIVGALLGRYRNLETKPLLTLYFYLLSPAIILDSLMKAELSFDEVTRTFAFVVLNLLLLWLVASLFGKALKLPAPEAAGLTLVATLSNAVNYGLPLVLLAFGQLGLEKAAVYVIAQMIIVSTLGIYFAARSEFSVKNAVRTVFTLPAVYAAALAVVMKALGLHFPSGISTGISMVAVAYAPVVLTVLGAQMASVKSAELSTHLQKAFWTGMFIRMLVSPITAWLALILLGVKGTLFSVLLILSSMPAAVNAGILAERFNASPKFVTRCILWTTLASFIVLPLYIVLVKSVNP
jgi:predicted permease